jgi:hypothetical protein
MKFRLGCGLPYQVRTAVQLSQLQSIAPVVGKRLFQLHRSLPTENS